MGIAIADRKNRCDFGALSHNLCLVRNSLTNLTTVVSTHGIGANDSLHLLVRPSSMTETDVPRGPKDQKNSRFRSRLKISIENEI